MRNLEILEAELEEAMDKEIGASNYCLIIPVPMEHKKEADELVANLMEFAIYSWKNQSH